VIAREGEVMVGVEPAVVGVAETVEGANIDHGRDVGKDGRASSVSHVTSPLGSPDAPRNCYLAAVGG
jgi:hypothetical protein